jgi:hypothetical protein
LYIFHSLLSLRKTSNTNNQQVILFLLPVAIRAPIRGQRTILLTGHRTRCIFGTHTREVVGVLVLGTRARHWLVSNTLTWCSSIWLALPHTGRSGICRVYITSQIWLVLKRWHVKNSVIFFSTGIISADFFKDCVHHTCICLCRIFNISHKSSRMIGHFFITSRCMCLVLLTPLCYRVYRYYYT